MRALTEEGHHRKKYTFTGPESVTFAKQVRTISEAIGRTLQYAEVSPETARKQLLTFMSPAIVDALPSAWAGLVNKPTEITSAVAEVTGRPARAFREWVLDHAADFRLPAKS